MPWFNKKRSRLFLCCAALLGLIVSVWLWTLYDNQAWLKTYVVRSLEQHFGESVRYDSLAVHWRGVDLYRVQYRPATEKQRFDVTAEEITVRFGYWELVRLAFKSEQPLLRISILNPTLRLSAGAFLSPQKENPPDTSAAILASAADSSWRQLAGQYRIVETIDLNHGRIVLQDSSEHEVEIMRDLNGWVRALGNWKAQLKIHGYLAEWQSSALALATEIDLRYLALDSLTLKVEDWRPRGKLPLPLPARVEMTGGALSSTIRFTRTATHARVQVNGALSLRDGELHCWPDSAERTLFAKDAAIRVDSLQLSARLQDGWLFIDEARQRVNAQTVRFLGRVHVMPLPFFQTLEKIALRALPPSDSARVMANATRSDEPQIDLDFAGDSLALAEWLTPFVDEKAMRGRELLTGKWQLNGNVSGEWRAPRVYAKVFNRSGRVYGQRMHYIASEFWYAPQRHDSSTHGLRHQELRWQGSGALALSLSEKNKGAAQTIEWEGSGKMDCSDPRFPLEVTLLANGSFKVPAIKLLPVPEDSLPRKYSSPRLRWSTRAQMSGPLMAPQISGQIQCDLERAPRAALRWLGNFSLREDTIHVQAQRPDHNSRLLAQVWHLREQPHFRVQGLEAELLATWLGEEWARSLSADFDFDFMLAGRSDSLTLRAEVKKKENQAIWLALNAYMLPVQNERLISGTLEVLPQRARGFEVSYTCHVLDSVITISDIHAEKWLTGNLRLETRGPRALSGNLRLLRADLTKLFEEKRLGLPRYSGELSAEVVLGGTLNQPAGHMRFWLYDGFFNDVGNFFMHGEGEIDSAGWRLMQLRINKDQRPYIHATASYQRDTQELQMAAEGAGINSDEFLQALADVPSEKFHGALSFDLSARGPLADFMKAEGIPLTGRLAVRKGAVRWFGFEEITARLTDEKNAGRISRLGMFTPRVEYRHTGFALNGSALLPFNTENEVDIRLQGEGNFLAILPEVASYFKSAESTGKLRLRLAGPYKKLRLPDSQFTFAAERVQLHKVAPEIKDLNGELRTDERGTFVAVKKISGKIRDATFHIRNEESVPPLPMHTAENLLERRARIAADSLVPVPLRLSDSQIYLGALFFKSSANGLPLNIPGLMQKHEVGRFEITGLRDSTTQRGDADEFILAGPWTHPVLSGGVVMEGVNFQFPFDESTETDSTTLRVLLNLNWNVLAQSRRDNRYVIAIPTAIDEVFVSLGLDDEQSRLKMSGVLADSSFFAEGKITSHRGVIEYLDMSFQVESCGAEFDRSDWLPIVYGRGHAVVADSTDFPQNVYLTLYTRESATGQELPRGRFQNAFFKLSTDNPALLGGTQGELLASLGYSADRLGQNAKDAMSIGTDHFIIRPFLRPVERALERKLGLDVVRFSSRFTRNLLTTNNAQTGGLPTNGIVDGRPPLLRSSRLTLGKHILPSLYLHYVGQVETGLVESEIAVPTGDGVENWYYDLQLRHRLGLEYRLNPSMLLQFEYDYNPLLSKDKADPRIWLRHSFPVEFPLKEGK